MSMYLNKKKKIKNPKVVGKIRQSQMITSFGIGFMVDFVKDTVIIAGVDEWDENKEENKIYNENLQSLTNVNYFLKPQTDTGSAIYQKSYDIGAYVFPEKLYCPNCKRLFDIKRLEKEKNPNQCLNCKNPNLVASRFVVVCENGHMEDFPYDWWIHRGEACDGDKKETGFKMYNVDGRSSIDSLYVECLGCKKRKRLQNALTEYALAGENGYKCRGYHPHLKNPLYYGENNCSAILKTRLRTSSSIYFPVIQSALSIPPWSRQTFKVIYANYDDIKWQGEEREKAYIRDRILRKMPKNTTLEEAVKAYEYIKAKKESKAIRRLKDIFKDEYIELSKGNIESDEGEFSTFVVDIPEKYERYFEKIVAVDRLTEIQSLYGFTRLKPWDGTALNDERIVPLAMNKKRWLPAVKMKGEGIFFKFNEKEIERWNQRVLSRYDNLKINYNNSTFKTDRFSTKFVMLHTFAHLLMRQISNECGYSVASLKEKIYTTFHDEETNMEMCGVLIYLATSDSDGSLGGLISIAENTGFLEKILDEMLQKALWCSGDPICVNSINQGNESLNYAACHDCTLLPETSCEFRNCFLDRVSIVGKVEAKVLAFFRDLV